MSTISVVNPDGQVASVPFTVANPPPTISSVSPSVGPVHGGISIVITGTGFDAHATVNIDGREAVVTVVDSETIHCTMPDMS